MRTLSIEAPSTCVSSRSLSWYGVLAAANLFAYADKSHAVGLTTRHTIGNSAWSRILPSDPVFWESKMNIVRNRR